MRRHFWVSDPILTNLSYATLYLIGRHGAHGTMAAFAVKMANVVYYNLTGDLIEYRTGILPEVMRRLRKNDR